MRNKIPQIDKEHKIAVIGAGPAGIHMASLLKKRGFNNVTVLEKTDRIGGKSLTFQNEGVPHEMGTCFMHNGYHRIKKLVHAYGLRADIPPEGRAIFLDDTIDATSLEFGDFVSKSIYDEWQEQNPQWAWIPPSLVKLQLLYAIWKYSRIYKKLFGTTKLPYAVPLHLSDDVLEKINMSLIDFLRKNKLDALISLLRIMQAAQGYGYLENIPAYYGLCWVTPEFLLGLVKQVIGLTKITRMLPDGFETLWQTIAKKDALSVKLETTIHTIDRDGQNGAIEIEFTDGVGTQQVETFDFLILTINLRSALSLFKNPTETEKRLFNALKGFTLTTTLYESDAIPGYSTADYDKGIAYFPDTLRPSRNNEWYADRNDRHIFAEVNDLQRRFGRQTRVAFQFSDQESSGVCAYNQDEAIAAKLKAAWAEEGIKNPQIIEQFSWPYFMHFPKEAIRAGYLNELFAYQGNQNTWYAGASACFESVNHVVNYNHALVDTYL